MSTILDGVIIFILLIALIAGITKGFVKSIWKLIAVAVLVVGIYFAAPLGTKLICNNTSLDTSLETSVEKLYAKIKGMDTEISADSLDVGIETMKNNGLPAYAKIIVPTVIKKYAPKEGTFTAKAVLAEKSSYLIILIGVSFILIIVIGIILNIFKKMFFHVAKSGVIKPLDKLLGLVYSVAFASAVLVCLGGIAYTMRYMKIMTKVNQSYESSKFFKYIYGENPLQDVFEKHVNLGKLLNKNNTSALAQDDNADENTEESSYQLVIR